MVKHPQSRAERLRLKKLHEKKETVDGRRSTSKERGRHEADQESSDG